MSPAIEYIRIVWRPEHPNDPIEMHCEVLPDRTVPRMVEIFADGRAEAETLAWHATRYPRFRGISLVDGDMPTVAEIRATTAADAPGEIEVFESTEQEFETVFQNAAPLIGTKEAIE